MPGIRFTERMEGQVYRLKEPFRELAATLDVEARIHTKDKVAVLRGRITIESFADAAPVQGTLALLALAHKRLPYDLFFVGADAKRYRVRGEKDITPLAPLLSMTVLPITIFEEDGEEIARGTLRFDWRSQLVPMIRSLRPSIL